jgi:hypothetical protein
MEVFFLSFFLSFLSFPLAQLTPSPLPSVQFHLCNAESDRRQCVEVLREISLFVSSPLSVSIFFPFSLHPWLEGKKKRKVFSATATSRYRFTLSATGLLFLPLRLWFPCSVFFFPLASFFFLLQCFFPVFSYPLQVDFSTTQPLTYLGVCARLDLP